MPRRKLVARLTGFLCLLLAAGCIDYQETIEVKRDGSVEIAVYATILKSALPMVKNRPELRQLLLIPIERGAAEKLLPQSAKIKYWTVTDGPGIRIFDAAIVFENLDEVQKHVGAFASSQNFRIYRDNDGNFRYEREVPAYPIDDRAGIGKSMLENQMANSNLEFTLKVPTRFVASNGQQAGDRTAVWKTTLPQLREHGMAMTATIEAPPEREYVILFSAAGICAAVLAILVLRRKRRRSNAGAKP